MWISQTGYLIMPHARKIVNSESGALRENCAVALRMPCSSRSMTVDPASAAPFHGFPRYFPQSAA